ncbi:hypothetical protein [Paractinoplanes lichenicola]|uniref:Uncharacterized protein n=1 Tax=Paractinoplanes lichenicola TaxID=2802976 RepID=A0ABS1W5A6_9ACTN|nr:hypothetical protein [Actinoplanes lichenicola]MBL7261920.1 hypothetical protein [Actinoplanes lichenicola]
MPGSGFMGWLRRRFRLLGGVAGAVSYADTGPYAGAPRNPELRVGDEKGYSTIEYVAEEAVVSGAWIEESQMSAAIRARERARRHVV